MAFRNRIVRLSQLIADIITGATVRTAEPPNQRIEIGEWAGNSVIRFYSGLDSEDTPASIDAFGIAFSPGGGNVPPDAARLYVAGNQLGAGSQPYMEMWSYEDSLFDSWDFYANRFVFQTSNPNDVSGRKLVMTLSTGVLEIVFPDLKFNGRTIQTFDYVRGPWTTDPAGEIHVPHGMGQTPRVAFIQVTGGDRGFFEWLAGSSDATQATFKCYTPANVLRGGGVPVNGSVYVIGGPESG